MGWFGTERRFRRLGEVAALRQQGAVVLEDIHDPHNAEAVFRTCDALGFQRVCLVFAKEPSFDPRRIGKQSSSSANKWLSFETYSSITECLRELHDEGYEVAATTIGEDCESVFSARLDAARLALLLGNEHRGLSGEALALCDRRLTIPMRGMVQSLNLSVTAAVCLYEITRQRIDLGMDRYLLAASERRSLLDGFLKR